MNNSIFASPTKFNNENNKDKYSLSFDMAAYYKAYVEPFLQVIEAEYIKDQSSYKSYRKKCLIYRMVYWMVLPLYVFLTFLLGSSWIFILYNVLQLQWGNVFFFTVLYFFVVKRVQIVLDIFLAFFAGMPFARYSRYKNKIIPILIKYYGDDYSYSITCSWKVRNLGFFGLQSYYNSERTQFYIQGKYKNVAFKMRMTEQFRKTKDSTVTVFKGLLFELIPKKKFSGRTMVSRIERMVFNGRFLEKVNLESPDFNRIFYVHADDQIEARTLLTPSFMQRLLNLEKKLDSKIDCSFCSGSFLIRVPTCRNYFSIDGKNIRNDFKTVVCDMQIIFEIVDGLKLDLDIGL